MKSKAAYPWFYFLRIARISLVVFLPTLILVLILYRSSYKTGLVEQMTVQVREDLETTKLTLEKAGLNAREWCESLPKLESARYSLINREGRIRCDSDNYKEGEKIEDLTEVQDAFSGGFASSVRYSDYFQTDSLFSVIRLSSELALRKVIPISSLRDNLGRFDRQLFFRIVPVAVMSYLLFIFLFYLATRPLGIILSKVEKFKSDIPLIRRLNFYTRKINGQILKRP